MRRTLKTLADLQEIDGGVIEILFRRKLAMIAADLIDRPAVSSARKLTVELLFCPVADPSGALADVKVEAEVKGKVPVDRTRTISMGCRGGGEMVYNDLSPDDHHQATFDEVAGDAPRD